ncbi:hypothetical protein CAPTEDRAFT_187688, partial [Capitella teleta]
MTLNLQCVYGPAPIRSNQCESISGKFETDNLCKQLLRNHQACVATEREVRGENSQSDCASQSDSDEEDVDRDLCRVGNIEWCKCGQCKPMDSASESCCCQEHEHVASKLNEMQPDPPACIAHTPMFADLCLKLHVLEVAHMYYRTQYGNLPQTRIN